MDKLKQAIIEKIHGLPWEEAKWKEAESNQCNFKYKSTWFLDEWYDLDPYSQCFYDKDNRKMIEYLECGGEFETEFKILGQPITLSRVLQALNNTDDEETQYINSLNSDCSTLMIQWSTEWGSIQVFLETPKRRQKHSNP